MDQTQAAEDPEQPTASGSGMPDAPEQWGTNGLIGEGRYRLTRRLGRGGMAEVFAAEDVRLGRTVAVKLMRGDLAEDPVAKARFTREAQSVAGLNHHAVVAVYDSGEDRKGTEVVPYIVMELCEGRTIRELLVSAEAPPVDQALIIVSGVLEALAYSHQHGIVHRDIKPANVVITHAGAIKVMDFGIARALHGASTTMTQTGMVMGTPQYLSPEQALGKAVDHRSDLYATGCLLYELLTLRPPFVGETPLSVVYQHVQDEPHVPSELNDRVPPELDGLVLRALAKNPDDRFQSAEEMRGVAQYALRMLAERGGWTGTWDTGYVGSVGGTNPPGAAAATTALPHARTGNTAELGPPLIMGPPGGAADTAYGYDDGYGRSGGHRGRTIALLVIGAILAVGLGVFFAIEASRSDGGHHKPSGGVSPTATGTTGATSEPTQTTSVTGGITDDSPSGTASTSPSQSATSAPPSQPTTTPPTKPTTPPATTPPASPTPTQSETPGPIKSSDPGGLAGLGG
jgi:serine/threonine-protein kinase